MSSLKPDGQGNHDLGSTSNRWGALHVQTIAASSNVTIEGNLTVNGATTQQNVTTIQVKDPIMQLNYEDGSALTGADSGIHVGRDGATDASLIFDETADVWKAGLAGAEVELLTLTASQTLTNKVFTNPTINTAALSGTFTGTPTFSGVGTHSALDIFNAGLSVKNGSTSAGFINFFEDSDNAEGDPSTTKSTKLIGPAAISGNITVTLPNATDTLVGKATTDTLTNKTLSGATLSGTMAGTPTFSGVGTHSALDIFDVGLSVKNGSTSAGFVEFFENSGNGTTKITLLGAADVGESDLTLTLPASTDTLVGKATTDTLTNKTLSGAALSGTFTGTPTFSGVGTHSALDIFNVGLSVKNGSTSAGFVEFFENSGNGTAKIKLLGAADVGESDLTLTLPASTDTLIGKATTDTLTNKTLTNPTINTAALSGTLTGTPTFSGVGTHSAKDIFNAGLSVKNGSTSAGFVEFFEDSGNGTNKATLIGPAATDDVTLTLPAATDTLVGRTTTDTLTNKTLSSPALSGTVSGNHTVSGNVSFAGANTFENSTGQVVQGPEGGAGILYVKADQGDDDGDTWKINVADGGVLTIGNDISSSDVSHLTMTPNATVANSLARFHGDVTIDGDLIVSGDSVTQNVATVQVEDPIMQINYSGGSRGAKQDSGIHVGRLGATDASLIWDHSNSSWAAGLAGSEIVLVDISSSQTLTNKTLTAPTLSGTVAGTPTFSGVVTHSALDVFDAGISVKNGSSSAGFINFFEDSDNAEGDPSTTKSAKLIGPAAISGNITITLPSVTDTLVGIDATQTLTSKTLSGATLSGTMAGTPTFSEVGTHSAKDVFNAGLSVKNGSTSAGFVEFFENGGNGTNKATLIGPAATDDVTLTLPAATDTLAGLTASQTLTNKTLTSPVINTGTVGTSLVPSSSGAADLGTTSVMWGDIFVADDKAIQFGESQDAKIEYDESGTDQLRIHAPAAGVVISGTTPTLVIGDNEAEDVKLVLDHGDVDFYMGIDESDNKLHLGLGSTVGTDSNMVLNSANRGVEFKGNLTLPTGVEVTAGGAAQMKANGGALTLLGTGGINIGTESDTAIDIDASTLTIDASDALSITSSDALSIASTSSIGINSSGASAAINIGSTNTNSAINIGSDGTRTITIGENGQNDKTLNVHASAADITLDAGTNNVAVTGGLTATGNSEFDGNLKIDGTTGVDAGSNSSLTIRHRSTSTDVAFQVVNNLLGDADGTSKFKVEANGNVSMAGVLSIDGSLTSGGTKLEIADPLIMLNSGGLDKDVGFYAEDPNNDGEYLGLIFDKGAETATNTAAGSSTPGIFKLYRGLSSDPDTGNIVTFNAGSGGIPLQVGGLENQGHVIHNDVETSGAHNVSVTDHVVLVQGAHQVNLPGKDASTQGRELIIINEHNATIVVAPANTGELIIDGSSDDTYDLPAGLSLKLVQGKNAWYNI